MQLRNQKLDMDTFLSERTEVVASWATGREVDFEDGVRYQLSLPESKRFSSVLAAADREGRTLRQPRAGVALVDEHITLLQFLEEACDLLPSTIDAPRNKRSSTRRSYQI